MPDIPIIAENSTTSLVDALNVCSTGSCSPACPFFGPPEPSGGIQGNLRARCARRLMALAAEKITELSSFPDSNTPAQQEE